MSVLVLVAPGQGAQAPGFLRPWLDLPGAADLVGEWSEAIGLDLAHFGTAAGEDEIRDTAVAQPLLVAGGLLSARALNTAAGSRIVPGAVAGHSVGEITAATFAGVFDEVAALRLVRARGLAMAEAAAVARTGMAAVLAGDYEVVTAHLERLGLTAANVNGAGQIVAAGTAEQIDALVAEPPEGARKVVKLKVAGAFHTGHMEPAVKLMAGAAREVPPGKPAMAFVSNRDGATVAEGTEILDRLVGQVASPVRWDLCMGTLTRLGATGLIEVCPGGTLKGLAKRAMPGVATVALKTPNDLEAALKLAGEHAVDAACPAGQAPSGQVRADGVPGGRTPADGGPAVDTTA